MLGSHISLSKPRNYLVGVVEETIENGANIFMIFTGPPQNLKRVPVQQLELKKAQELAAKNNIDFSNSVVHAPYIFNLAQKDADGFIRKLLVNEIIRMTQMGIKLFVVHPGYHVKITLQEGIRNIVENIKAVFKKTAHLDYWFCLETMSGKKNQLGKNLEELREMFVQCNWEPKLAICLDTCHLHDSGYNLAEKENFKKELDTLIGLDRVKVIHLGDSMNPRGSKKDRHANYKYGHIGWETILSWAYDEYFSTLPIIVETPFWRTEKKMRSGKVKPFLVSPYKHEIKLLREREWRAIPDSKYRPIFNIKDK